MGSGTLRLHRMQHESISVQREDSSCLTTKASAEAQMVTKPPSATQSSDSMTICLHTQKVGLRSRTDCTRGERCRATDTRIDGHLGVIVAPLRLGEPCGQTGTLLHTHSAQWVGERSLAATIAIRDPVAYRRTSRRGQPCVYDAHAVASDRRQRVLGPASEPLRRKPRAPHGIQLRLPRRVVPQDCERGVECSTV